MLLTADRIHASTTSLATATDTRSADAVQQVQS